MSNEKVITKKQLQYLKDEVWLPCTKFIGNYVVSNHGRVARVMVNGNYRLIQPILNRDGGCVVNLSNSASSKHAQKVSVAKLVAVAFMGMDPGSTLKVRRVDGVKTNNQVWNLILPDGASGIVEEEVEVVPPRVKKKQGYVGKKVKGVWKDGKRWVVQFKENIGLFDSKRAAIQQRKRWELEYLGNGGAR